MPAHGLQVKQSEVHGMAKRGGSVFSHVRFGAEVWSPTIPQGETDILVALEWAEGLRWLNALRRDSGTFIADTQQIVPPIAFRDRRPGGRSALCAGRRRRRCWTWSAPAIALDATRIAAGLGNIRIANTVLLGALSTALPFRSRAGPTVLREFVPPRTVARICRRSVPGATGWKAACARPRMRRARPASGLRSARGHRLEITEAWCKGCDICVKMCPERCLRLDGRGIAELADPAACTGCRAVRVAVPGLRRPAHRRRAATGVLP